MKEIWLSLFMCLSLHIFAQTANNGIRYITKFSGLEFGVAYPYITPGYYYELKNSHTNLGISGHFSFGKMYSSGIILSCEPGLFFSSVGETVFVDENWNATNDKLLYRSELTNQYQILFLQLPGVFEFSIGKKIRLGGGPVFTLPIMGSGDYKSYTKRLNIYFPYYEKDTIEFHYSPYFELRLGFSARMSFSIHKTEKTEQSIGLSYYYEFGTRYPGLNTRTITLSFISRNIVVKEVRQKWDRYLIRHSKKK